MKKILLFIPIAIGCFLTPELTAQVYSSQNITLLSMLNPNSGTVGVGPDNRRYSGCWGWKQPVTNKEYAIVGGSSGTYFIDVSNPATPSVSAYVPGRQGNTYREIKTYQNYCYVVSDDGSPNTFQIIDMAQLPATVTVVHNGTTYFERGHTIWIDNGNMYIGATTYSAGGAAFSSMNIYSLATPTAPALMRRLDQDFPTIGYVHDMYVRNDTVFASCGNQGLNIFKWSPSTVSFSQLGSYTTYSFSGYNHASSMTPDAKKLVFCDEVPASLPIKLVDIQNLNNVQPLATFNPHPNTTPHNPYVINNDLAVVACYQDGLNIYNIANANNVYLAGFFDTYPQSGFNTNDYSTSAYRGNWGAYPFLPSGIIIAVDMQNGVFILDPSVAYVTGLKSNNSSKTNMMFFPNPATDRISLNYNTGNASSLSIKNMLGQTVFEKTFSGPVHEYVDVNNFANGTYFVTLSENDQVTTKKLIINH